MLKKYYSSEDERELRNLSELMFEEISSGVYYVIKDRHVRHSKFVSSDIVISSMENKNVKTAIKGSRGVYANFNWEQL